MKCIPSVIAVRPRRWFRSVRRPRSWSGAMIGLELLEQRTNPSAAWQASAVALVASADASVSPPLFRGNDVGGDVANKVTHAAGRESEQRGVEAFLQTSHGQGAVHAHAFEQTKLDVPELVANAKLNVSANASVGSNVGQTLRSLVESSVTADVTSTRATSHRGNENDDSTAIASRAEVQLSANPGNARAVASVSGNASVQRETQSTESPSTPVNTTTTETPPKSTDIVTPASPTQVIQTSAPENATARQSVALNGVEQARSTGTDKAVAARPTTASSATGKRGQAADIDQLFANFQPEWLDGLGVLGAVRYGKTIRGSHHSDGVQSADDLATIAGGWSYSQLAALVGTISLAAGGCAKKMARRRSPVLETLLP